MSGGCGDEERLLVRLPTVRVWSPWGHDLGRSGWASPVCSIMTEGIQRHMSASQPPIRYPRSLCSWGLSFRTVRRSCWQCKAQASRGKEWKREDLLEHEEEGKMTGRWARSAFGCARGQAARHLWRIMRDCLGKEEGEGRALSISGLLPTAPRNGCYLTQTLPLFCARLPPEWPPPAPLCRPAWPTSRQWGVVPMWATVQGSSPVAWGTSFSSLSLSFLVCKTQTHRVFLCGLSEIILRKC